MDVRNCRKCGRLFNYVGGPFICPKCKEDLEKKFQEVKLYIREHPGAGIKEVADECEIETNPIYQWLREERLELAEGSMISLSCENCGTSIKSGKYCEKCKRELMVGLNQAIARPKEEFTPQRTVKDSGSRMRFLERDE